MRLLVLNGPNLNLLGTREPEVYGSTTLEDLDEQVETWGSGMGVEVETEQSNSEARIIELIQTFEGDGIVFNPGALTHTSRAISDAIRGVGTPVVEVHISNIRQREPWRAGSVIADACVRSIYGRGVVGYRNAMRHLVNRAAMPFETIRYGPHPDHVGDLRRDGGDLVILLHGGLWRQEYERDTTDTLAVDLARRGYSTWNIEYRRLGSGGGWPHSAHDALTALDFVPQLGLDSKHVILVGHSAGAHLAMWAAPRSATEVLLHVALAPLLDLAAKSESDEVGADECRRMLTQGAPGSSTPEDVPTVIVHGDTDQIVPVEHSIQFANEHGIEHHSTDCDHFSLLDPTTPEWSWVIKQIGSAHDRSG
ncbi:MAG TPA: type II 3-dehydroquinate dehydratase [Acidimicrobiia bacterium]